MKINDSQHSAAQSATTILEQARFQIQRVVDDLEAVRYRLVGLLASVPPSHQETSNEDVHAPDPSTEIRALITGCLKDSLDPLIRDLGSAAKPRSQKPSLRNGEALGGVLVDFDLNSGSEEMHRVLHGLVVRDHFSPEPLEERPKEIWTPGYTAEEAGLEVVFLWGRWFAAWRKLEVPSQALEEERWIAYRLEEDKHTPSTLFYVEI
jgi:hypothetical protein